jgi:Type III restriction enzyme, res subunit
MTALRPYQSDVIGDYHAATDRGQRGIIVVCPTGGGKTVMAASIIDRFVHSDIKRSVLVLAHRREIINLTSKKLHAAGVAHGIIQAGFPTRPHERVQVASIQTLWTRAITIGSMNLPPADLLVIDECHHAPAETYRKIIKAYPGSVLLGLTATPCRGDGRGLGGIFQTMIETPQVADLIKQGYLVGTRVYAPCDPDLRGVRTQAGDYVESQLAERMDRDNLVGESSRTGINTASAARRSLLPSRSSTRSISATNSSNPACAPNTSMARRQSRNATPRWRGWNPATSMSSAIAWCSPRAGTCPTSVAAFWRGRRARWASIARWSGGSYARPMARPTPSCRITAAQYSSTASSKTRSSGRSTLIAAPKVWCIGSAANAARG